MPHHYFIMRRILLTGLILIAYTGLVHVSGKVCLTPAYSFPPLNLCNPHLLKPLPPLQSLCKKWMETGPDFLYFGRLWPSPGSNWVLLDRQCRGYITGPTNFDQEQLQFTLGGYGTLTKRYEIHNCKKVFTSTNNNWPEAIWPYSFDNKTGMTWLVFEKEHYNGYFLNTKKGMDFIFIVVA